MFLYHTVAAQTQLWFRVQGEATKRKFEERFLNPLHTWPAGHERSAYGRLASICLSM